MRAMTIKALVMGIGFAIMEAMLFKYGVYNLPTRITYWASWIVIFTAGLLREETWSLRLYVKSVVLMFTVEDAMYWVFAWELPYSWAVYYPVIWHIPIDDVIGTIIYIVLSLLPSHSLEPQAQVEHG